MKSYSREDQRLMAAWAADCAERVLSLFEAVRPSDERPRHALAVCREWIRTGIFEMATIRGASLAAHAAARDVADGSAAGLAAHAAGQAVATAHVPQHAYGGAYYALKAIAAADPDDADVNLDRERRWQAEALPEHLRREIMGRILVTRRGKKLAVTVRKGPGF